MSHTPPTRPALPIGWFYPDHETAQDLHAELQRELPAGHLLTGRGVETFAWREGATDDVLFRHIDEPERFTVIHLSWLGRTEINALHPTVQFDGTFDGFLAEEERLYGITPPKDASSPPGQGLLEALLDSWDRNNTILLNLLRALPDGGLEARAMESSPSIAELFTHIHYVRLVFVLEDAPELARDLPKEEWAAERDPGRITDMLNDSAKAVRDAVRSRVEAGRDMDLHYDHPILLLQHMLWHEGYHHGQMKLALKMAGHPMADEVAGPLTWDVWMRKK